MFSGKVILITGASSGIGEAAAFALGEIGHTVYAAARRTDKMSGLAEKGIKVLKMDVTVDKDMKDAVAAIIKESGRIDVLVNNAGYGSYGALEDVPLSEGKYQFEVNVFGLARLTQLVLPHMRAQKTGRIINISSMGGRYGEPLGAWYHATKFAVEGLSDSLRMELRPHGIDVVIIEPGVIQSEWAGITSEHVLKFSGESAYSQQALDYAATLDASYGKVMRPSPPSVVAKTITRAVRARKPRVRYITGQMARLMITNSRIFPARMVDWILTTSYKTMAKMARKSKR